MQGKETKESAKPGDKSGSIEPDPALLSSWQSNNANLDAALYLPAQQVSPIAQWFNRHLLRVRIFRRTSHYQPPVVHRRRRYRWRPLRP